LTSLIVKALLLGLALIIVGIPVAILVTPVGWALVAAGACVYFYVPAAAAFRAASKVQPTPWRVATGAVRSDHPRLDS